MKRLLFLLIIGLLTSCTTTQLVSNWKNPHIDTYHPSKILVIGLTANVEAQKKFEKQLKDQLEIRGTEVVMGLDILDPSFRTEKMTTEKINTLENKLINDGFDTVLFSKVIGIEDKVAYKKNYKVYDQTYKKFKDDYLLSQDIFYTPKYYEAYSIYHAETTMYCICPTKDRELLWKGYVDIIDPQSMDETVNDYVRLLIIVLEEQQLISPKITIEESPLKEAL